MPWPKGKPRITKLPGESAPVVPASEAEQAETDAFEEALADGALTPDPPTVVAPNGDDKLPDSSTIDPKAIKQPVLSRQGWVCPA
jgi:hypothetical protein